MEEKNARSTKGGVSVIVTKIPQYSKMSGKAYKRARYEIIMSSIIDQLSTSYEIENAPESLNQRVMKEFHLINGFCGLGMFDGELLAVNGVVSGGLPKHLNKYEEGTEFRVMNVVLGNQVRTIGEDVVLLRNDNRALGFVRKLDSLVQLLIEAEISIRMCLINSRVDRSLKCESEDDKKALETYWNSIENGVQGVAVSTAWSDQPLSSLFDGASQANQSLRQAIETYQFIKGQIQHEMGLQANYNMKREAINSSETMANEQALRPFFDNMIENIEKACEDCNRIFGTDLKVKIKGAWAMRDIMAQSIENETIKTEMKEDEKNENL